MWFPTCLVQCLCYLLSWFPGSGPLHRKMLSSSMCFADVFPFTQPLRCVLRLGHVRGSVDSSLAAPSSGLGGCSRLPGIFCSVIGPLKMFWSAFGDPRVTINIDFNVILLSIHSKSLAPEPLQVWSPRLAVGVRSAWNFSCWPFCQCVRAQRALVSG